MSSPLTSQISRKHDLSPNSPPNDGLDPIEPVGNKRVCLAKMVIPTRSCEHPAYPNGITSTDYADYEPKGFRPLMFMEILAMMLERFNVIPVKKIVDEFHTYVAIVQSAANPGGDQYFIGKRALVFKRVFGECKYTREMFYETISEQDSRAIAKVYQFHIYGYPEDMNYGPRFIHAFLQDLINVADGSSPPPFYAHHDINRPAQALDMLHQLLQCLGIIHSERLYYIHANISPNNLGWVLNDDNGELDMRPRWCLNDFTDAELVSSDKQMVRTLVLTPGYGAPETDLKMTNDFLSKNPRYKPCEGYRYYPLVCMKSDVYAVARVVEETYPELKYDDPTIGTADEQKLTQMLQKVIRCMKSVNLEERLSTKDALVRIEKIKELSMPIAGVKKLFRFELSK